MKLCHSQEMLCVCNRGGGGGMPASLQKDDPALARRPTPCGALVLGGPVSRREGTLFSGFAYGGEAWAPDSGPTPEAPCC